MIHTCVSLVKICPGQNAKLKAKNIHCQENKQQQDFNSNHWETQKITERTKLPGEEKWIKVMKAEIQNYRPNIIEVWLPFLGLPCYIAHRYMMPWDHNVWILIQVCPCRSLTNNFWVLWGRCRKLRVIRCISPGTRQVGRCCSDECTLPSSPTIRGRRCKSQKRSLCWVDKTQAH